MVHICHSFASCHSESFTFCHSDPKRSEGEESYRQFGVKLREKSLLKNRYYLQEMAKFLAYNQKRQQPYLHP